MVVVQTLKCVKNSEKQVIETQTSSPKGKVVLVVGKNGNNGGATEPEPEPEVDKMTTRRRVSARIKTRQSADKELLVRKRVEILDEQDEVNCRKRAANVYARRRVNVENVGEEKKIVIKSGGEVVNGDFEGKNEVVADSAISTGTGIVAEKSAHLKVKDTLRLFNKHYLHFVQVCSLKNN